MKKSGPDDRTFSGNSTTVSLASVAGEYLETILAGDRRHAVDLVTEVADSGIPIKQIYTDVFQQCQFELGRLWEENRITVAKEHLATAITQLAMSQLYNRFDFADRVGKKMVAACVGGELHEIGLRMVADFFELDGWNTHYLGANTPIREVVEMAFDIGADIVALSTSMTFNVEKVRDAVEAIRTYRQPGGGPKILVGGRPFNVEPTLWQYVGADYFAASATGAAESVGKLSHHSASVEGERR